MDSDEGTRSHTADCSNWRKLYASALDAWSLASGPRAHTPFARTLWEDVVFYEVVGRCGSDGIHKRGLSMMKQLRFAPLCLVLCAGCNQHWVKPGATEQTIAEDAQRCSAESASQATFDARMAGNSEAVRPGATDTSVKMARVAVQNQRLMELQSNCMRHLGYEEKWTAQ